MKTVRSVGMTLLVIMLIATLFPHGSALAISDSRTISYVPVLQSPRGTVLVTVPTYTWTRVSGATKYQFQLYTGTTKVLDRVPGSSTCVSTTCSFKPSSTLGYNVYKWRVRAMVAGIWNSYSAFKFFTVSTPSFDTQFNSGSTEGWARKTGGTWNLTGTYYQTDGLPDRWTDAFYSNGQFTDFDYSARVFRYGNDITYLAVRMGSSIGGYYQAWYPGYVFGYTNMGYYAIWKLTSTGVEIAIADGLTPAINKNGWNTLRVKAVGNKFWFYINGTSIHNFQDTDADKRMRGFVGVVTGRKADATEYGFYMNGATLTVIPTPQ